MRVLVTTSLTGYTAATVHWALNALPVAEVHLLHIASAPLDDELKARWKRVGLENRCGRRELARLTGKLKRRDVFEEYVERYGPFDLWITGLRKSQSGQRAAHLHLLEHDVLWKFSPFIECNTTMMEHYCNTNELPFWKESKHVECGLHRYESVEGSRSRATLRG